VGKGEYFAKSGSFTFYLFTSHNGAEVYDFKSLDIVQYLI